MKEKKEGGGKEGRCFASTKKKIFWKKNLLRAPRKKKRRRTDVFRCLIPGRCGRRPSLGGRGLNPSILPAW